jgi:ribonuclease HII
LIADGRDPIEEIDAVLDALCEGDALIEPVAAFKTFSRVERRRFVREVRTLAWGYRKEGGYSADQITAKIAQKIKDEPRFEEFCEKYGSILGIMLIAALSALVREIVADLWERWRNR